MQKDVATTYQMLEVLNLGDVEIHRAKSSFVAEEIQYPEGTFIIYLAQPFGCFAKTLLERQVYPEIRSYPGGSLKSPYDVVAHTLPLLMGLNVVQIDEPFEADNELLEKIEKPKGTIDRKAEGFGYVWAHSSNDDIIALNRLLKKNYFVFWAKETFQANQKHYPPGTMIVKFEDRLPPDLEDMTRDLSVHFEHLDVKPEIQVYQIKPVKLGLYKPWTASIDEGWTRWVLEQYEIPYTSILNKDIKKGDLHKDWDVIILPDINERTIVRGISEKIIPPEYADGIGTEGIQNMISFVKDGGTLITLNSGADFPLKHFNLSVHDSSRNLSRKDFFIPGSILSARVDNHHPIGYGFDDEVALFFRRSPVFAVSEGKGIVTYPDTDPLLSGWVNGETHLFNKSALVEVSFDKGKVILIGFPVLYRGQSRGTFRFLFNAIFYGPAKSADL